MRPAAGAPAEVRLTSHSAAETRELAAALAGAARAGDRIGLHGPLGAGKTQFAKGFALGLGVPDIVMSPTFTLMAEYAGRLPLFHVDLYRLSPHADADAYAAGLLDERERAGVTLIEWAERLSAALDAARLDVTLDEPGNDVRHITLAAPGRRYGRYLDAARSWGSRHRLEARA